MRRLEAVRRLLTRRQVRESLVLTPQPGWRIGLAAGAQAALAAAIALPLVALSPVPHLIGFASLGALVASPETPSPSCDRAMLSSARM